MRGEMTCYTRALILFIDFRPNKDKLAHRQRCICINSVTWV